jgi:hypothetical protein
MKSRVLESLGGTTTAKWMACSSTTAISTNAAHWTMGGALVKGWRWADEIIFIAGREMAVGVMARRVVMVD